MKGTAKRSCGGETRSNYTKKDKIFQMWNSNVHGAAGVKEWCNQAEVKSFTARIKASL